MNLVVKNMVILPLCLVLCSCATTSHVKIPSYESRRNYVGMYPRLSSDIKEAILKGKVIEGMTKKDVLASWGEPSRIHRYSEHQRLIDETDEKLNDEAWHYDRPFYSFSPRKFVRFGIDGIVNYVSVYYN